MRLNRLCRAGGASGAAGGCQHGMAAGEGAAVPAGTLSSEGRGVGSPERE